ncbi:polysaccharide pyruvyl transferase family protein [Angustibacter aerolatus]
MRLLIRSGKDPTTVLTAAQTLRRDTIGTNAGNLVFGEAVHRSLSVPRAELESTRWKVDPDDAPRINETYDAFVLPLANAFRPTFHRQLDRLSDLVERLTIPVVVVGVGAQAPISGRLQRLAPLETSVRRFVSAVLDRSATIGVRGEVTEGYLRRLGFSDVEVIGCPSMFQAGDRLAVRTPPQRVDRRTKVALTLSPYVRAMEPALQVLLERHPRTVYVPQELKMLRLMLQGPAADGPSTDDSFPVHHEHPLFTSNRMRFFVDPTTWRRFLAARDVTVGTRIHGTITSLQAGTPALLVAHDSRTLELADYHQIPYLTLEALAALGPEPDLVDRARDVDLGGLHAGHPDRLARYAAFLERNGLPHVFTPETAAGAEAFDRRLAATSFPRGVPSHPPAVRVLARGVRRRLKALRHRARRP